MVKTFKCGNRTFIEIEDSKVECAKVMKEWIDENGIKHQKIIWEEVNKEIELGSLKKPSSKTPKLIKITVPHEKSKSSIFKGFEGLGDLFK